MANPIAQSLDPADRPGGNPARRPGMTMAHWRPRDGAIRGPLLAAMARWRRRRRLAPAVRLGLACLGSIGLADGGCAVRPPVLWLCNGAWLPSRIVGIGGQVGLGGRQDDGRAEMRAPVRREREAATDGGFAAARRMTTWTPADATLARSRWARLRADWSAVTLAAS